MKKAKNIGIYVVIFGLVLAMVWFYNSGTDEEQEAVSYTHLDVYKRQMIHRTTFGLMVRSKSEALIAEILRGYELDFRYEEALHLFDKNGNETIRYPDFTIYLKNGTVVYWEHMGMLGDEIYRNAAFGKLELYYYNGILPGANLMITCDDNEGAMDVGAVSRIAASLEV